MRAVPEKVRGSAAPGEQKSDRREISFGGVADFASQNEIVAPIIGRLAASGSDMIERHRRFGESLAAVRAHGSVLLEEPPPRFGVGNATRWVRGEMHRLV
jgi:hypothetical protein